MSPVSTEDTTLRRSPLEDWYLAVGDGAAPRESKVRPRRLAATVPAGDSVTLTDLSWRRRFGVKGPAAEGWLAARGLSVSGPANRWSVTDGVLVGRLATSEFLIENLAGNPEAVLAATAVLAGPARPAGVYPVARQDLVIALRGPALNALLRQVCSVDFEPLLAAAGEGDGPLVLTSMIGVGVVAVPCKRGGLSELTVWTDPSYAHYFWTTLITVAADLGGGVLLDDTTGA